MLPLGQIGNPMQRFIYGEPYIDISFSTIVKYQEDTDENTIRTQIFELIDPEYQKFSAALIPNIDNVLGVRLPELRKIAKKIAKDDWRTYLKTAEDEYFEEIMLQGMVIGYVKTDINDQLSYVASFIPKIDNWSVCDSFCIGLKFTKRT